MAIERREPNTVHTVNGSLGDQDKMVPVEITETWFLGHWEMWKLQEGLESLTGEAKEKMAYFAWLIGAHGGDLEIRITRKWEA